MKKQASLIATLLLPFAVLAQDAWPSKAITFVVPYPPGGPTDLMARLIATPLAKKLNVPVIVENKAGASGNIGTGQVVKAKPDGYTILLAASGNLSANQFLYNKLGFDPIKDLAPVVQISKFPLVLEVSERSPIRSFQDYVQFARNPENRATFGSASNGSPQHLGGELFKTTAKIDISHVPYKGAGPALVDLMGGQITSMFDILGSSIQHIRSGKLRPLAVTTKGRSSMLPDVPSVSELGYPDFEYYAWHGISTTAGTPKPIITRLNAELRGIFADPAFKEKWLEIGSEVVTGTPEQFDHFIQAEARKMESLIKGLNIQLD
ncbi:Bug family tripartite tricarboxylate transporter substrate binding protein [Paenacidovorax monticola]|uniref:Tripartite tricarboxylate transporter substrate binding protein n=1 Tax=Paenacidovorax monticola TaxID=1926868 RepID=A0A7H0HKG6_9BURK|nr:tripartite tricarboxylate transporter substrate binding protein [Paenacidovorax monticola]QNP61032.1 tripartite tricarboxylate transporter substrate binding protein [Paenacidovorax monticola]